ncbi:transport protein [Pseudomonas aeruginosa]|nr:transport protein [Pseudomonas aeruginosa]
MTAIVILGSAIILRVSSLGLRIAFWVALGLLCAGFFRLGIGVIFVVIAALALACWFVRGGRETLRICVRALRRRCATCDSGGHRLHPGGSHHRG